MKARLSHMEGWCVTLICLVAFSNLGAAAASFVTFHLPHTKQVSVSSINASNVAVGFMFREDDSLVGFVRAADGAIAPIRVQHQQTNAVTINGGGTIAGVYNIDGPFHAFIRSPEGIITTFDAPGAGTQTGQGTGPTSINDSGLITGYYIDSGNLFHGFVRDPDGAITAFDAAGIYYYFAKGDQRRRLDRWRLLYRHPARVSTHRRRVHYDNRSPWLA